MGLAAVPHTVSLYGIAPIFIGVFYKVISDTGVG